MTQYFTGKPCKRGHIANRFISNRRCVECHRLYEAARRPPRKNPKPEIPWDLRNKDKHLVYEKNRKARLKEAGQLSIDIYERLLVLQNGLCVYCNVDITEAPSLDHKIPISRGGTNTDDNVHLVCTSCNSKKWAYTHEEYLERIN